MTKKLFRVLALLLSFSLSSCHSLVEDEFVNFEPVPVLNGLLQADSIISVEVSLTANLSDSTVTFVDNALVVIENNSVYDTLSYAGKGKYVSKNKAKAGETYICTVQKEGFRSVSAKTTIPLPTPVDSVILTDLAGRGTEGEKISSIEFQIPNDLTKRLYWQVQLIAQGNFAYYDFENNELVHYFGDEEKYIFMLAGQDSVLLNEANPLTVFSNKKMKCNDYTVKFYVNEYSTNLNYDYNFYIVLSSIDESYYKYIKQYYIYETSEYYNLGKSPQRYPLYSNVNNGYGIFTGISKTRALLKENYANN
jgi:hypothetical protein